MRPIFHYFGHHQKSKHGRKYSLKRDTNPRMSCMRLPFLDNAPLPEHVDNGMGVLPPCYDQGQLGICYACAVARAVHYWELKTPPTSGAFMPSIFGIAWNAQIACKNTVDTKEEDGIYSLRATTEPLLTAGFFPESMMPRIKENLDVAPNATCVMVGQHHLATGCAGVAQDLYSIKSCLASGQVIVFGMTIYPQYESSQCMMDGMVDMPDWIDRHLKGPLGGHAQLIVGYDDHSQRFIIDGSWGMAGDRGRFHIPYAYLTNPVLAFDFQIINGVKVLP